MKTNTLSWSVNKVEALFSGLLAEYTEQNSLFCGSVDVGSHYLWWGTCSGELMELEAEYG